jgi:hypothetical protein
MQLSQTLDDLLCQRYPVLYAGRRCDAHVNAMGRGFEIGDGWFAIVDALSEVVCARANVDGRVCPRALQVKQKFGSLRFHVDAPNKCHAVIDLAQEMSRRVCEVSGRPGRLCRIGTRDFATLAPGAELPRTGSDREMAAIDIQTNLVTKRMDVLPLAFRLDDMARCRADVLAGPVDVPDGWSDLADALLRLMQRKTDRLDNGDRVAGVRRIWRDRTGMRLDWVETTPATPDLSAMAAALSRRIDPVSGRMHSSDL